MHHFAQHGLTGQADPAVNQGVRNETPDIPDTKTASQKTGGSAHAWCCVSVLSIGLLLLSGCGLTGPERNPVSAVPQTDKSQLIARWNNCLEGYFENDGESSESHSVTAGMETCQGYRYDVLNAYPSSLTPSIDRLLTNAAYRTSYRQIIRQQSHPKLEKALKHKSERSYHSLISNLTAE